jgi:hypothetical protein
VRRGPAVFPVPPPTDRSRRGQAELLLALALARSLVGSPAATMARALSDLGAIDLPDRADDGIEPARLQTAAPLYFASELEQAGLLPTAELVAGLFASGAINQPLGPSAALISAFWRGRRERLEAGERQAIFDRVFEPRYFEPLMRGLCEALVAQGEGQGLRERIALETAAAALADFLDTRLDAMAAIAAADIVTNIDAALAFLRDRLLQTAFAARSLWQLVALTGAAQGRGSSQVQMHVDRGRSGQTVLLWLAREGRQPAPRIDPADYELVGAAQRWLTGQALAAVPPATAAA